MNSFDEEPSVYSAHYDVGATIDTTAATVWKHFLHFPSWVNTHRIEAVSGTRDRVGFITRVFADGLETSDYPLPHYHYCKLIKLIPERHYLLKTYSERGGSYGLQFACFDDFRFTPFEGKTQITFNLYAEFKGDAMARDPSIAGVEASRDGMVGNLMNLKRLAEGS
jgi:hypothetical protein